MRKFTLHSIWQETGERIAKEGGVVMVIGAVDIGKSTFCAALAFHALQYHEKVAVVDADIGQSDIGPPGTIGMGFAHPNMTELSDIPLHSLYFVGDISPQGHFLDMVIGTQRMVQKAISLGAGLVLVDTTGLISGMPARKLKSYKIEAVRPNHLVALQKGNEVEHIIKGWERTSWLKIHRLPPSPLATPRSFEERRINRERKFRSHFAQALSFQLPMDSITFRSSPVFSAHPLHPALLLRLEEKWGGKILWGEMDRWGLTLVVGREHRLHSPYFLEREVGRRINIIWEEELENKYAVLIDEEEEHLDVCIVEGIDFSERRISIFTPFKEIDKIATISFGTLKIDFLRQG
ncbi:MAG: Clp1/GlmU family protein [bacterium]